MPQDDGAPGALQSALKDRYAIGRVLGRGGMATVYLARDLKHDRDVALKVLDPALAASLGGERFLREIRIGAQLAHPHILPLLDSGDTRGHLFFVTPYVPGGSLRDLLDRENHLPVGEALRVIREVGAGLGYAHRQGFIHRDVKPENILFADGLAVLADFGIARAAVVSGKDRVTDGGIIVGTPAYMSPEQASGDQDIAPASDQYSLGCVLYEMLGGEPPFHGANARATMAQHVTAKLPPLRARRPDVPAAVDHALTRALAKNPGDRFPGVTDFLAALALDPAPGFPAVALQVIAVLPFVNSSPDPQNEYLADGITDELIGALAKVEGLRVASRTSVFALKGKPQDVRAIGALLDAHWVLEGSVRRSGDRLRITAQLSSTRDGRLLWSERYDRELRDVFEVQEELARTIVHTLATTSLAHLTPPVPRRYTDNVRAYGLYLKGRFAWNKRTQEGVAEAIRFFEQAVGEDPNYALAYTGLSDSYALQIDYRSVPVREGFERAKEYARKALALDDGLAEAHASLAWALYIYDWDWTGADLAFQRAIAINPRYATARQWYAFLHVSRGAVEEALIQGHTAMELDPASVSIRRCLGWLYFYARRYQEAIDHLGRAVAMNPTSTESATILALAQALGGDLAAAERSLREALELPGATAAMRAYLGWVLARQGRPEEARTILSELTADAARGYVTPVAFAVLHLALREHEKALDWAERAREERRGWLCYLNVNPLLDPLRREPRFQNLVRQMKLIS